MHMSKDQVKKIYRISSIRDHQQQKKKEIIKIYQISILTPILFLALFFQFRPTC